MKHMPHRVAEEHAYACSLESQTGIKPLSCGVILIDYQCHMLMSVGMCLGGHGLKQRSAYPMSTKLRKDPDRIQIELPCLSLIIRHMDRRIVFSDYGQGLLT